MLNSRVGDHPDKGHPGYQGDHVDYCMDILRSVGSPRIKLLFDIYHVQIMDGDVIRRIKECGEMIGHVHTAGNPGRGNYTLIRNLITNPSCKHLLTLVTRGMLGRNLSLLEIHSRVCRKQFIFVMFSLYLFIEYLSG